MRCEGQGGRDGQVGGELVTMVGSRAVQGRIRDTLEAVGINAATLDRIRLARGFVGKVSYVAGAAVLALAVIAWRLEEPRLLIADAVLVFMLFATYFAGVLWF